MLKINLPATGKIRIYWDGAALLAHAEALGDPSLNWLDLPALTQAAGHCATHVWIAPGGLPDRARREAVGAYGEVLRGLGVERRLPPAQAATSECLRCGHGWRDQRPASELTLALAVLGDAFEGAYDAAFVFAAGRVASAAITAALAHHHPDKSLGRVTFGSVAGPRSRAPTLELPPAHVAAARLPPMVVGPDGARIAQPLCWGGRPRRGDASPGERPSFQPA
jgi:hypothetical protein